MASCSVEIDLYQFNKMVFFSVIVEFTQCQKQSCNVVKIGLEYQKKSLKEQGEEIIEGIVL